MFEWNIMVPILVKQYFHILVNYIFMIWIIDNLECSNFLNSQALKWYEARRSKIILRAKFWTKKSYPPKNGVNVEIENLIKTNLSFLQLRQNSKSGEDFQNIYPRAGEWPHCALIDPQTGENLDQWEGDVASNPEASLQKLTKILTKSGVKLAKKRKFDEITDKTEDEQIAIDAVF